MKAVKLNKRRYNRVLMLMFALLLLLPLVFCSCRPPESDLSDASDALTPDGAIVYLWNNATSEYKIVIPDNADSYISDATLDLNKKISSVLGSHLSVATDLSGEQSREIIIGATSRGLPQSAAGIGDNEFIIAVENRKVYLYSADSALLSEAVDLLFNEYILKGSKETVSVPANLNISRESGKISDGDKITIKVASYNIANGKYVDYDYKILARDILDSGAEIVALQEVDQNTSRNHNQDTLSLLAEYTGYAYYEFAPTLSPYKDGEYGIAVLSKYPIVSSNSRALPKISADEENRAILHTVINIEGTALDFFSTHIQQSGISPQLGEIASTVAPLDSFVVAGDFNYQDFSIFGLVPSSYTVNNDTHRMRSTINGQAFDNMIVSNKITASDAHVIITENSDHHMLVCDITIKKK